MARRRLSHWLEPLVFLGSNRVSLAGAILTTSSAFTMLGFWLLEVLQLRTVHPYGGIILFLVLPGIFVLGLILMPVGLVLRRRHLRARGELPQVYPTIDLRHRLVSRGLGLVAGLTVLNVAILSAASYQGVRYMDSTQFCGLTCHTVMAPEYSAYLDSPHSRVACAECHIGPGAGWFVRSKLSGTRQVIAVTLKTYSTPIPSPVKHLRPARETCEHCHWPLKFHGEKVTVKTKYAEDEKNTRTSTVLVLKVGGRVGQRGQGIHGRHLDATERISYLTTDERRQVIPRVTYVDDSGKTVEYVSEEVKLSPDQLARAERRTMDCMDCHNRPSHTFELPDRAVDRALTEGRISAELPYIKKKGVELLKVEYPDRATADRRIGEDLAEYYRTSYPEVLRKSRGAVEQAAAELRAIYGKNVFPNMKVGWGTYPNNIGHENFIGCFRCHDDNHKSAAGSTITQDCEACHALLAQDEENPKILADLGLR
jgi:hypothetical protein